MAQFKTLSDLMTEVKQRISLVPGLAVQVYGEDKIASYLRERFESFAREPAFWWPWLMDWRTGALDGITGVPAADAMFEDVDSWDDVRGMFLNNDQRPLPQLPQEVNPFTFSFGSGQRYAEFHNSVTKRVRVWPLATTGTLYAHVRVVPSVTDLDDTMPFDWIALVNGACYKMSEDDGGNPAQSRKFLGLAEDALKRVKLAASQQPYILDPRVGTIPNDWAEMS